jgi:hypothetical protein
VNPTRPSSISTLRMPAVSAEPREPEEVAGVLDALVRARLAELGYYVLRVRSDDGGQTVIADARWQGSARRVQLTASPAGGLRIDEIGIGPVAAASPGFRAPERPEP